MFDMITERVNQLMEKNKPTDPVAKGYNDCDMIMVNESPSLPKFDYQSSSSSCVDFFNCNSVLENEFNYDINLDP
ncbi:hypothetical protein MKX01_008004 [Papaver californicum]|nr:hypothetical protein MKX01_008004 [Papaver californicum]